jgi:signal transduction histidine kinase
MAGIAVNFKTTGNVRRVPAQVETTLFRVIQEVVSNITRHAQASNVDVGLHFIKDVIEVQISDDGKGFDVQEAVSSKDRPRGLGLVGIKERIELVNGTADIRSRLGGGTEIDIKIKLNQEVFDEQDKDTGS